ncbi:MAG: carboxypeptidase M32, partial [candidate division Zixibacteria bacterium]|nr:carboxypeptidase M32 [candidate division Zixibacteria bacterium]
MKPQEAYKDLKSRMKEIATLNSTAGVLYWDQETYLPSGADDHRAEQLAQIEKLTHEWFTGPVINELISTVETSDLVSDRTSEAGVNIREWRRLYNWEVKLPSKFVQEFARTTSKATRIWSEARKNNDFKSFQPQLEKIINLCKEKADYIGYETEKYDALLDEFEPGAKTSEIEMAFKNLRIDLVELIGKIKDSSQRPDIGILKRKYDVTKQKYFAESVASAIGYNFEQGRVDEATHPSCNELG